MNQPEIVTIGLSEAGNDKLDEMTREHRIFAEKMDGFRFAVALALAQGALPAEIGKRAPFLNIGSFDAEGTLKKAVETLVPDQLADTTPYRLIERLAEWGVNEMYAQAKSGGINFAQILEQAESKAGR